MHVYRGKKLQTCVVHKRKEYCKDRCYQNMWREKNEKSVPVHACLQIYQKENYKKMNKYKKKRKIKEKRREKKALSLQKQKK